MKYAIVEHQNFHAMGDWFETHVEVLKTEDEKVAREALWVRKEAQVGVYQSYLMDMGMEEEGKVVVIESPTHDKGDGYRIECLDIWTNLSLATIQ